MIFFKYDGKQYIVDYVVLSNLGLNLITYRPNPRYREGVQGNTQHDDVK